MPDELINPIRVLPKDLFDEILKTIIEYGIVDNVTINCIFKIVTKYWLKGYSRKDLLRITRAWAHVISMPFPCGTFIIPEQVYPKLIPKCIRL